MTNYKEILRLHSLGINNTRIAEKLQLCPKYRHINGSASAGERNHLGGYPFLR